ncbi:phospholipid scramblase 3-like [Hyperolius riggenbachi]|uniref:phospholipid scramblase 3-like n=1 Tax=Hyperolius riggenbachi TaxID=752182 RepID=UPI0035A33E06
MSSTGLASPPCEPVQEDPPNYNAIAPYAPPDSYPAVAPGPQMELASYKGVPSGLVPLLQVNQLCIREKFSVSQGWGRSFDVLNDAGQQVFQSVQEVVCCGPQYDVRVKDKGGETVMQFLEHCACTCDHQMEVHCPPGYPVGSVKLHWNNLVTHLSVLDASGKLVLLILGPSFPTSVFGNTTFEVKSSDEQHVVGLIKMETDNYLVSFPLDLEVTVKAILLGAAMYLDNLILASRRRVQSNARTRARQHNQLHHPHHLPHHHHRHHHHHHRHHRR